MVLDVSRDETRSKMFERSLREYAKNERKMHLTSQELRSIETGESFNVKDEKDIFELLGLKFILPELRNA